MVQNIIFYFSGTGNSYDVAKKLASGLGDTKLISMTENPYSAKAYCTKRVGFVFPVYYGGLPLIVEQFIEKVKLPDDLYLFAIATCGISYGNALHQVLSIITNREYHMSYLNYVMTVNSNLIRYRKVNHITKKLNCSDQKTEIILQEIEEMTQYNHYIRKPISELVSHYYQKRFSEIDHSFYVNDTCNRCGICAKVCAVKNIDLVDGKPIFLHQCEMCLSCIQYCPQIAINYKKRTRKRERYHNPSVSAEDMIYGRLQR